jgi:molybdopterin-binding protein
MATSLPPARRPGKYAIDGTSDQRIGAAMRLSARNKINATVTGVTRGEATANVTLDAGGVRLVASITVEAADELGLTEGAQVIAIVKASDVIVAVPD